MRLLALVLTVSPVALCCGPCTLASLIAPREYDVATELTFREQDAVTTQRLVSHCRVVDQRDSIAKSVITRITGDRHSYTTRSGEVLVFGPIMPCRYDLDAPLPPVGARVPLVARHAQGEAEVPGVETLGNEEAWLLDDPVEPMRLEILDTRALLDGELPIEVSATICRVDEPVTRTLDAELPWLATVEQQVQALRAQREQAPRGAKHTTPPPHRFEGVRANAYALRNGATCELEEAGSTEPELLDRKVQCPYTHKCSRFPTRPCLEHVGGLLPTFDPDGSTVRFDMAERRPGYRGTLRRHADLPATAPIEKLQWKPGACLDGLCLDHADFEHEAWVAYPEQGILVHLEARPRSVMRYQLVTENGPIHGGT